MVTAPPKESEEVYDPKKRDPQYAHADASPLWELHGLLHHHHPAIALHARQLLCSQPLTASADLSQNTLSHFLDRFVYKNAKKVTGEKGKGSSAMQPAASALEGVKLMKGESGNEVRVNEKEFIQRKPENVPVDEMFFYKFFKEKSERNSAKAAKVSRRKNAEESDEEGSDEEEEEAAEEKEETEEESEASEGELDEDEVWKVSRIASILMIRSHLGLGHASDDAQCQGR